MRYSQEAADVIVAAAARARGLGHSFVGSVHLLMALCGASDEAGLLLRSLCLRARQGHHGSCDCDCDFLHMLVICFHDVMLNAVKHLYRKDPSLRSG